jgi:hypothetical protein
VIKSTTNILEEAPLTGTTMWTDFHTPIEAMKGKGDDKNIAFMSSRSISAPPFESSKDYLLPGSTRDLGAIIIIINY